GEGHLADTGGGFAGDVLEVRRLTPDHHAHTGDRPVPPTPREMAGGLGKLEGAGHPVDVDVTRSDAGRDERVHGAVDEPLGDPLVEARGHDREARALTTTDGTHRGLATRSPASHLREAPKRGARACRASCSGTGGYRASAVSRRGRARRSAGRRLRGPRASSGCS